jgi:DNA polymerase III subunit epsilon
MLTGTYVVLDFETTGLSPEQGDRITEIGAVKISDGQVLNTFQSLVNCNVQVPKFITAYTGITQRMVDQAPLVTQVFRSLTKFIEGAPVIAHNASFDQRFFVSESTHCSLPTIVAPFICSMRVARRAYPHFRSHALGSLASELGLRYKGSAHRAAADAELTAHVMLRLGLDLKVRHNHLTIDANLLRRIMRMPIAVAADKLQALAAA